MVKRRRNIGGMYRRNIGAGQLLFSVFCSVVNIQPTPVKLDVRKWESLTYGDSPNSSENGNNVFVCFFVRLFGRPASMQPLSILKD